MPALPSAEEAREKEELIGRILELQNTLHDLSQRVNSVKEENAKLKAENQVRGRGRLTLSIVWPVPTSVLWPLREGSIWPWPLGHDPISS